MKNFEIFGIFAVACIVFVSSNATYMIESDANSVRQLETYFPDGLPTGAEYLYNFLAASYNLLFDVDQIYILPSWFSEIFK